MNGGTSSFQALELWNNNKQWEIISFHLCVFVLLIYWKSLQTIFLVFFSFQFCFTFQQTHITMYAYSYSYGMHNNSLHIPYIENNEYAKRYCLFAYNIYIVIYALLPMNFFFGTWTNPATASSNTQAVDWKKNELNHTYRN